MRTLLTACAISAHAAIPGAEASTIVLFGSFVTSDVGISAPAGATAALAGPGGLVGGLQSGAVGVVAPGPGYLRIDVLDVGFAGDVFETVLDGTAIGTTSRVPVGGADNSAGTFILPIAAGAHTVDLWDYILSYIGGESPYGGAVDDTFSPADVSLKVAFVPEPASALLFGAGLLGLGFFRARP